jgi:oligopeptide/dipeptide ABC transporter ATP-binding protein
MTRDPNDFFLKVVSRIPVLRRYEKVMYRLALDRAVDMLRAVRIPDPEKIANSYPFELSGGMAQRVMIAIALSCSPKLLIADEPTTAVDVTIQAQVLKLMKDLKERVGASVLLITHNLGVVAETCDRVGVMYAGVMAEIGPTRSVFKEPLHPYTKGLMESIPRVTVDKERLEIIKGTVPNLIRPPPGCRFHPRCPVALPHCGWSASEVRSRLQAIAEAAKAAGSPVPDLIEEWDDSDRGTLVLRADEKAKEIGAWMSKVLDERKGEDVVLQAVESVDVDGDSVSLKLIRLVKPPMLEGRPGHFVACYQYGGWPPA